MMRHLILLGLVLMIAACGRDPSRNATSNVELPYDASLSKGDDARNFAIEVENEGAGVEEVRESVRFEATKYCLLNFGGSDAQWDMDPATQDWAFTQDGDELIFTGRCTVR